MTDPNKYLAAINLKVQQLLKQYELLLKEHDKILKQSLILKEQKLSDEVRLEDLTQENLILKASLQSLEPAEKKDLETRLTQYIKNIDKSISLLSQ